MDGLAMRIPKLSVLLILFMFSFGAPVPADCQVATLPRALTLGVALELAERHNPGLRADATLQDASRGDAITAGLPPNPPCS
jgi:hypothetical protein